MYGENDLLCAKKKEQRALLMLLIPAIILLGGVIWSFAVRIKWLTILLSVLCGCWSVFVHSNLLVPRRAYSRHIDSALHEAGKEAEGRFLRMEETPLERNDVNFYAFYINVGEKGDPEDDRLFYYDALKAAPDWHSGDRVRVRSYDKFVSSVDILVRAA